MTSRPHRLAWLPPFLVGASAAIAAEVAIAVLLYGGPGFVRSLTAILAIEGIALGGGLWSAPTPGPDLIDRLRRRWLLCLTAFLIATLFGGAWSLLGAMGEDRLGQGLGLALLAALPLYAAGSVLGGMASVASTYPSGYRHGPGAAAALGAGVGFVATGVLLPRAPLPASLFVACVVMLSLGGMIYGAVLGSRVEVRVRARRPSKGGEVRVEERRLAVAGREERILLEGPHERRRLTLVGHGELPWDVTVARALMPEMEQPWRVLSIGGGASWLARSVLREHPNATVDVLERTGAVIELGRDFFDTELSIGGDGRADVRVGHLEDLIADARGPYDVVMIDSGALAPFGGVNGLSRVARSRLVELLDSTGVLVWGPMELEAGQPERVDGWPHAVFTRRREDELEDFLLLTGREGSARLPETLDSFDRRPALSATP